MQMKYMFCASANSKLSMIICLLCHKEEISHNAPCTSFGIETKCIDSPGLDDSNEFGPILHNLLSINYLGAVCTLLKANQLTQIQSNITNVCSKRRTNFCSYIHGQGVPASVCDSLHVIAAGNYFGRFLYFASKHIANLVPRLTLVDFLIELWQFWRNYALPASKRW